jgi:hypothetical protein
MAWPGTLLLWISFTGCVPRVWHRPDVTSQTGTAAYTLWVGPFALRSSEELDSDGPEATVLRELVLEWQSILGPLEHSDPIEVYLFRDRREYESYLQKHGRHLPARRALFVQNGARRRILAYRSPELKRDLRHEASHALLNCQVQAAPLWLDEGLAEYFEADSSASYVQPEHVRHLREALRRNAWSPDLSRLQRGSSVEQFSRTDYAESWLWVHLLLSHSAETRELLSEELRLLRHRQHAGSKFLADDFATRLRLVLADPAAAALAHLERLGSNPP